MVVVMRPGATQEEIDAVRETIESNSLAVLLMPGSVMAIGIPTAIPTDLRDPLQQQLEIMPGVSRVTQVSRACVSLAGPDIEARIAALAEWGADRGT